MAKKNKNSLKRRIRRTFGLMNLLSLAIMMLIIALVLGLALRVFTGLISTSVSLQMANALSLNIDMKPEALGEPYIISGLDKESSTGLGADSEFSLIHYVVFENNKPIYDSFGKLMQELQGQQRMNQPLGIRDINVMASAPYRDGNDVVIGHVDVEFNPFLVYIMIGIIVFVSVIGMVLVLVITQIAVRLISPTVVKPLVDLERKMAEIAEGDLDAALKTEIQFKKPILEVEALSAHSNEILNRAKTYVDDLMLQGHALSYRVNQISNLFDQIDQGVFQIDEHLKIGAEYSQEAKRIFGDYLEDQSLSELLFKNPGERQFIEEIFAQVFRSQGLEHAVFMSLLPSEMIYENKHLSFKYKLISDLKDMSTPKLMVICTDISDQKALELQMGYEQQRLKTVVKTMHHADIVKQLLGDYKGFATCAKNYLKENQIEILQRELHTFKGNFSQFDWNDTARHLHELETLLDSYLAGDSDPDDLLEALEAPFILGLMGADQALIIEAVGDSFFDSDESVRIEKEKLLQVEQRIMELLSEEEIREILPLVRALRYVELKTLLEPYRDYATKLAERLEKDINPLIIEGDDIWLDPDIYAEVIRNAVHLLRNCIDHGIETPEERAQKGKSEAAHIEIWTQLHPDGRGFNLVIKDDGRGIKPSKEQDFNWVFEHGNSSVNTDKKSDISGRGVGLSALHQVVLNMGGNIEVASEPDKGTAFTLNLPILKETNDLTTPAEFMQGIVNTVEEGFFSTFNLGPCKVRHDTSNTIVLNDKTAIVNLKGTMNFIVMVSANIDLLKSLVPHMVFFEVENIDDDHFLDDLLGEAANTLIGNALQSFDHREDIFHMGIPVMMSHSSGYIKYSHDAITSVEFECVSGRLSVHLIPIHSEFIVKLKRIKEEI